MSETLELAKQLIACPSITPNDAGCQKIIGQYLNELGFSLEHLSYGEVDNLWANYGKRSPLLVFAGHTDVVPTGPSEQWHYPPFSPTVANGYLYGRGAADMKGSIAAMLTATAAFIKVHPQIKGSLAFLLTSDEEGPSINGTVKVIEYLDAQNVKLDWCILGEPSSEQYLADTIKIGRRGSLSGHLIIHGKQGHIAYPQLADNPIHKAIPALQALNQIVWDKGNEYFPATSLQISNIHGGTGANNVIPGSLAVSFNFRYSPASDANCLSEQVNKLLKQYGLEYTLTWHHSALPFLTVKGELLTAAEQAIDIVTKRKVKLSTDGGTSDGRFIAPTGCQVIELGLLNATIHQIDECIKVADLDSLHAIYYQILEKLLT